MLGAVVGDVMGSVYEGRNVKTTDFPLFSAQSTFTDDTVLTVAIADAILGGGDYVTALKGFARKYPSAGYGDAFYRWVYADDDRPYNSWGNGAAMRVSPVGLGFDSLPAVLEEADRSARVTHDHPQGIKGAQATALAVFLARTGTGKEDIKDAISERFGYRLDQSLDEIRPTFGFDISCQGTVAPSIRAFLESHDFEDAVRKAVSLGGDSDTIACIAGALAQAFYRDIPQTIVAGARRRLPNEFLRIIDDFCARYG
jgi:ADP-ribosylglycohydrolase